VELIVSGQQFRPADVSLHFWKHFPLQLALQPLPLQAMALL
jgi:hypothetical protein